MPTLFKMLQGMQAKYDAVPIVTSRNSESKKKKKRDRTANRTKTGH